MKTIKMRYIYVNIVYLIMVYLLNKSYAQNIIKTSTKLVLNRLNPSLPGTVHIGGYLGKRIDQCITNRIEAQNVDKLVSPFILKPENDYSGWRGEYWGKWSVAASLACYYQPNKKLLDAADKSVQTLIKWRSANGYISTYQLDVEFKGWDVWNQKYVLLGLFIAFKKCNNK